MFPTHPPIGERPIKKRQRHDATIIQFEGGHTTLVHRPVHEVAAEVEAAREEDYAFYFLQAPNFLPNSVAFNPHKVVALIRTHTAAV